MADRIIVKEIKIGRGLSDGVNVSVFDGTNDVPEVRDFVVTDVRDTEKINHVWWTPIYPVYELRNFRWLDVKLHPTSPDDVQLRLLLQNSPAPPASFNLFIRIYCLVGRR